MMGWQVVTPTGTDSLTTSRVNERRCMAQVIILINYFPLILQPSSYNTIIQTQSVSSLNCCMNCEHHILASLIARLSNPIQYTRMK